MFSFVARDGCNVPHAGTKVKGVWGLIRSPKLENFAVSQKC